MGRLRSEVTPAANGADSQPLKARRRLEIDEWCQVVNRVQIGKWGR
jgi:hypothetical protein